MSYKVTHICYCGHLDELEIPNEQVEVKQLFEDMILDKVGVDFNSLYIFDNGKENKISGVLDFNEPIPTEDNIVSCEVRFNTGDHEVPIKEYKNSILDVFDEILSIVFPQGDVKLMTTENDDEIDRFYLCFYNTVDASGDLLSDDETTDIMARNLALIFTECGLKITYLVESY